jgi:Mg-chelatase subunit ChlD
MNPTTTTGTDLATTQNALDRLNKSMAKSSLDDLVKAKTRRTLLLVDCSGSMADTIRRTGDRKIDALRKIVDDLRKTHPVPVAAFGVRAPGQVEVVDTVPEPQGGTPLDLAIEFGQAQGATHLIVVTDGEANDEEAAFTAARRFGHQIDVFYIGNGGDRAAKFCAELAKMNGGTSGVTDLGEPKQLASKLAGLIGDGSEAI